MPEYESLGGMRTSQNPIPKIENSKEISNQVSIRLAKECTFTVKLSRLRSVANNAVRGSIWSHEPTGEDPFNYHAPPFEIIVDLVKGTLTPDMGGDSVEEYYTAMSRWFHDVLVKEGIPLDIIESAIITITPSGGKTCVIVAEGRRFESYAKHRRKSPKD